MRELGRWRLLEPLHHLKQLARRRVRGERQRTSRLCELAAVRFDEHRKVSVARRSKAQVALEQDLPRRRGEEIRAADDFGYALALVIHDHGEMVGERSIA